MDFKKLMLYGAVLLGLQVAVNLGIFATPADLYAYAASQDDITLIHSQLQRIEEKLDKLIMGY